MTIARTDSTYSVILNGQDLAHFAVPELKSCGLPEVEVSKIQDGWQQVRMKWNVPAEMAQDELAIQFDLAIEPDFWWTPHLAPEEGYVIGQHVFRSPAMIVQRDSLTFVVLPDLDIVGRRPENPWFMDFDAVQNKMWLGMTRTEIPQHVLFRKAPGMKFTPGQGLTRLCLRL